MYIKNGDKKFVCTDFSGSSSDESMLFYLSSEPQLSEDEIELCADNDFCMKTVKRSDYKNENVSEFGEQYLLILSNEDTIEEKEDINDVKTNKIAELSAETQRNIVKGFDLNVEGELKHFSLEAHDQQNIIAICQYLSEHDEIEGYLYHADGESFQTYSRDVMFEIRDTMLQTITECTEKYNIAKQKVNEAETLDDIKNIVL